MSNIKKILPSLVDSGNFTSDLVPDGSGTRDLGSSAKPWKDLYVTSGTINIGGETISVDSDGISFSKPIKVREGGLTRRLRATNSDFITTGDTGNFADVTSLESFPQGLNVGTSNNLASRKLHVVGDIEISGTIFQSGSVFEGGGGGGGGGGSSTFTGLSDTPNSFTASKVLTVNSAGNAVETTFNTSTLSGHQSVEQGYFTGLTLTGSSVGIVSGASGVVSSLDLADNKFDVSVIEERDLIAGEENFGSVQLLLPFDGSNGATSTSDSSDRGNSITFNGDVQISTAQSKFGGSSLDFDGTGDYLDVGGTYWNSALNSTDFTVEFWVRFDSVSGTQRIVVNNSGSNGWGMTLWNGYVDAFFYSSAWRYMQVEDASAAKTAVSTNTWYHVAWTRSGNVWTLFLNGNIERQKTMSYTIATSSLNKLIIGRRGDATGQELNGYLDDVRITVGVARYTSSFTPPTSAHPTSLGQSEAKYIGQIGGINDDDVDYGIQKLSNSQLMIKKLSSNDFTPDRLYVNVNKLGALGQGIAFDQVYTGDGTTTNYALSENVSNARDVLVSVEGLIQTPTTDYTLLGQTGVSFTTGVTSGHEISFRHLALGPSGATGPSGADGADGASANISYLTNRFTGNGVVSGFEMTRSISTADQIFVFVNGLVQDSGENFSVTNGTGLFFSSGEIASGDKIMVRHIY